MDASARTPPAVAGDDDVGQIILHDIHEMDIPNECIEEHSREGVLFREWVCRREAEFHHEKAMRRQSAAGGCGIWMA